MKIRIFILVVPLLLQGWPRAAAAQTDRLGELAAAARGAPRDVSAQLAYAHALIEAERLPEAEAQMRRALHAGGDTVELQYEAMRVKFASGNYRRARAACRKFQKEHPDHVLGHVCMARAFLLWRRSSRAFEHVERALAADPNHPEARLVRADALRIQGKPEEARAAYGKVLAVRPGDASAYYGLGLIDLVEHKPDAARKNFRKAHELDPDDLDVELELGRLSSGSEAIALLSRAANGRRDWREAKLALALAQLRGGKTEDAANSLAKLVQREPKNGVAIAQLGAALTELGKYKEAEEKLRKALELIPNDYDTAFSLARLYERTERHEEAFSQYRSAADLKREDPAALVAAARLALRLKRPLLATALLDKALERAPRSAQVLALVGDAWLARGDREAARDYYERARKGEGPIDRVELDKRIGRTR